MSISIPPNYRLRVKQRQRVVAYARPHGIRPASRHFGLARPTVQEWIRLKDRRRRRLGPALSKAAETARASCDRRADQACTCGTALGRRAESTVARASARHTPQSHTIQRVFRDISVPWLTKLPRRPPRQPMLFKKEEPGETVQVDVKVVQPQRETICHYTALDDYTRLRVLSPLSATESTRQPRFLPPGTSGDAIPDAEATELPANVKRQHFSNADSLSTTMALMFPRPGVFRHTWDAR